eukprot:c4795_g1_i1 orf=2-184(-)
MEYNSKQSIEILQLSLLTQHPEPYNAHETKPDLDGPITAIATATATQPLHSALWLMLSFLP